MKHLNVFFGNTLLAELGPLPIERDKLERMQTAAPATVNRQIALLKHHNPETGDHFKDLWLGLKKACRKAGLKGVTWHTFRHTFASWFTHGGSDLVTVKELLGHANITATIR